MPKVDEDKNRENRIHTEIMVDAYGEQERVMSWYYYLDNNLAFPFMATCIAKRPISPLLIGDEVDVIGMAPERECEREMFVMIRWGKEGLAVPLSQLKVIHADDEETREAVDDWHYWVDRGYNF